MSVRTARAVVWMSACAGLACGARSQDQTLLDLEVSQDGVAWGHDLAIPRSGGRVLVRGTVSWSGTEVPTGFASLTCQPVIRGVRPGIDSIVPFADRGNNTNGGSVVLDSTPMDGPFGRISPFASMGPFGTQLYIGHTHIGGSGGAPAGDYLRIARNDVTRWMGTGPMTGPSAANNFNGTGGLACIQKPEGSGTIIDPPYNPAIRDIVLFQFAIEVGPMGLVPATLDIIAPIDGMSRSSTTGQRVGSWFRGIGDHTGAIRGVVVVDPARITIPGPGGVATLILSGAVLIRRRR